jgi:hypothetical protein
MAGKTERLYIRITPEVKARLAEAAASKNRSITNYVEDVLLASLGAEGGTTMTNDEIKAAAGIFAICYTATKSRNEADIAEAQRFPLRLASQYVQKLHAMHKATPEIDKEIGELFERIDLETMRRDFEKCLTLQQQGVWMLEYAKRIF